jgi:CheY-like chemotaxis protein
MSHDPQPDTIPLVDALRQRGRDLRPAVQRDTVAGPAQRSLRVLIVDDEQDAADTLCAAVGSWGHDARRVYDGPSGLDAAADQLPNVVFLDVAMPGMDGYEMARHLRRRASLRGCFLVAMRTRNDKRSGPGQKEADIDLFLSKPMDLAVLEALLLMEGERLERLDCNRPSI